MDIKGLVKRMREEFLNDTEGSTEDDYRWKTANLVAALSASQRELSKAPLFLISDTSSSICQITVALVEGIYPRSYAIDERVLRIERLRFPGVVKPLTSATVEQLDAEEPGWDDRKGTPSRYTVDFETGLLTFNRQPLSGGVVSMSVKRLPLLNFSDTKLDASPEIKQRDDELIHGALKYAYLKDDKLTYDPSRASAWAAIFEKDKTQIRQDQAAYNPQILVMRPERF